jgi:hypothetical protein
MSDQPDALAAVTCQFCGAWQKLPRQREAPDHAKLITDLNIAIGEWDEDHPVSFMLLSRCRAALAADAQDARRYRWLRDHHYPQLKEGIYLTEPDKIDAAVDAALAQAPEDKYE